MSISIVASECPPGTMIWVPAASKDSFVLYQQGKVLAVDDASCTVRTPDRVVQINLLTTTPLLVNEETMASDMTTLHHIHEPAILSNLKNRSLANSPYSFMSSVLIAVNPLRPIPEPFSAGAFPSSGGGIPPHPYSVAEIAYQQMMFKTSQVNNQSIVIAGESGAGKTESAKMVLAHLVAKTSRGNALHNLDKRLLGTSPILESFGNSATLRNPNSSRFGKMMRLHFENTFNGALLGATVQSYLLERSRVTSHEQGERNFHVFYQLLAAANSEQHEHLQLTKLGESFRYVKPGKISPDRDLVDYNLLVQSLQDIGVANATPVFEILAGLLHLGEITFVDDESGTEGNAASVNSPQALQTASFLLGLDPAECSKVFCERKLVVQNKTVVSKRSARAAAFARDAAAKAIYSSLFDWLVRRINENVGGDELSSSSSSTCSLGVLDIFGFESFKVNQFEQLLINYCNEALQGTFNAQIFVAEASLYEKEGLFGANELLSRPSDNGICVEFLQSKSGLLAVIDSEGKSPDCSDAKMLQRIHTLFNNHPVLVKPHPKDAAKTFIVRHYCSQVVYTVGSFLEKNNDRLPDDLELFLASSQKQEVRELFPQTAATKGTTGRAPPPARSISAKFTSQIRTLVDDLESTKCSFIRCVKPNPAMVRVDGEDTWFDERYVQMQLNALNVPQTCEVLRNGFPTRLDYSVLVDLYWKVLPPAVLARYSSTNGKTTTNQHKAFCRALFFAFQIPPESYKLGNTKVFFKSGQLAQLDSVLKSSGQLGDEVLVRFRLCYIRTKWRRILLAAQALEKFNLMFARARKETLAATAIQSFVRRSQARRQYLRLQRGAREAQRLWRGRRGRELAREVRKEKIREAKRLAELEERTKREREEAAAAAKALEEQEERQRKEALEQAKAVEEALAKQEMETRAQEEKDQVKRRQSIRMPRKSVVALKAAKRSDISVSSRRSDLNPDMLTLRSKTLATTRKSYAGSPQRVVSGEQDELKRRRQSAKQLHQQQLTAAATVPKERQGSISAKIRQIRRSKTGSRASIMPSAAGGLVPPEKSAKPSNLVEQKSSMEKMATLARENFSIKVRGQVLVLDTRMLTETVEVTPVYDEDEEEDAATTSGGGGLLFKLKRRLLGSTSNGKQPPLTAAVPAARFTTTASSVSKKWVKLSYLLDKPARKLLLFNEGAEKAELQIELIASLKVRTVAVAKQQHAIELKASHKPAIYIAFETLEEKRVWERDVREAIIGYRAPVHLASDRATKHSTVENDERMADLYTLYSAQIRQERLAQLIRLYKEGEITKEEFDKTCEVIANTPDPGAEDETLREYANTLDGFDDAQEEDDFGSQVQCPSCSWTNNTMFGRFNCVKCGHVLKGIDGTMEDAETTHDFVLEALRTPFATEMPFEDGRVSGELVGKETSMDFSTYQEISLFGIDMRFRDEELLDLQVGWLVSHRLDKFVALHAALVDADGPLTAAARKRIPPFPAELREDSPTAAQELTTWLTQLFALVPQGGKQTDLVYHDDQANEDNTNNGAVEDDAAAHERFTAEWRSVKDVETGDVYYFNKVTGETTWVNPFNVRAMRDLKTKLPLNWEAVVDKETNDVYYWNTVTLETTWEKPNISSTAVSASGKGGKKRKLLEAKDLLHVAVVNRFLDLKRNTQRMDDLANNY